MAKSKSQLTKEPVEVEAPKIEVKKEVPLHEREDLVFEKVCPDCGTLNYSMEVMDRGKGWASIWFTCKKCGQRYRNWWYGSSPSLGGHPLWYEILRKPFQVICIHAEKGITVECIYDAFESMENPDMYIVVENDHGWKNTEYQKEYFIADSKRRK